MYSRLRGREEEEAALDLSPLSPLGPAVPSPRPGGSQASCPAFTRAVTVACAHSRGWHVPVAAQPGGASPAPQARASAEERPEAPAPVTRAGERHAWHESSSSSPQESCSLAVGAVPGCCAV